MSDIFEARWALADAEHDWCEVAKRLTEQVLDGDAFGAPLEEAELARQRVRDARMTLIEVEQEYVATESSPQDILQAALGIIESNPMLWVQEEWRCGTGFCLAGWYCQLDPAVEWASDDENTIEYIKVEDATGGKWHVVDWFERRLGLSRTDAYRLTRGTNTLEDLQKGVQAYLNGSMVTI